jgi:hypothetical protein
MRIACKSTAAAQRNRHGVFSNRAFSVKLEFSTADNYACKNEGAAPLGGNRRDAGKSESGSRVDGLQSIDFRSRYSSAPTHPIPLVPGKSVTYNPHAHERSRQYRTAREVLPANGCARQLGTWLTGMRVLLQLQAGDEKSKREALSCGAIASKG